jgi:hypothetical protein
MNKIVLIITGALLFFSACIHEEFDTPPVTPLPVGEIFTISELRQMYADSGSSGGYVIDFDASVFVTVTTDEASGNFYREAYVQDVDDACNVRLESPGGLRLGDSIRIYLNGVTLSDYNNLFQLDNVDNDSNLVILANQRYVDPEVVTISEINSGNYQSKLIQLNDVQFNESELGLTWADPNDYGNRTIEDCANNTTLIRTSNYANFASLKLPEGKGSLIAIAGIYNETTQLYIRTVTEVNMDSARCDGSGGPEPIEPVDKIEEYFDAVKDNEDIDIEGWRNFRVEGTRSWQGKIFQSEKYAQSTAYQSGLSEMETWLITPPVINTAGEMILKFESAMAFWAHQGENKPLTVFASTDYDGTNFETANWTELDVNVATENSGDHNWVASGDYPLDEFAGNVAVAFRYQGSDAESTSSRIDNVVINDEGSGGGEPIPPVEEVDEDFSSTQDNTNIDLDGWTNLLTAGSRLWQGKEYINEKYAQATGYKSGLNEMITWLITPPVINMAGDKKMKFRTAMAFWEHTGDPLEVMASTDFDGTNFASATWTKVNATLANSGSGDNTWVESGEVDLSSFVGNVAIAFVYTGSDSESTSMRIDDVLISDDLGGGGGGPKVVLDETFTSSLGSFTGYSVDGDQVWEWASFDGGCAKMTGYENDTRYPNEDWLVSPGMDLSDISSTTMNIREAVNFIFGDWENAVILISTDYEGTGDPSQNGTWNEVTVTNRPPGNNWDFQDSGDIDLSDYDGESEVYVAFRYLSTSDNASTWEISTVKIEGETSLPW